MQQNKPSNPEREPRNVTITIDADGSLSYVNWTLGADGRQDQPDETLRNIERGMIERGVSLAPICPIGKARRLCG